YVSLLDVVAAACGLLLPRRQLGEGGSVQDLACGLVDLFPHRPLGTASVLCTGAGIVETSARRERTFKRLHHFVEMDLGRRPYHLVAALRPADTADKAGATQRGQQVIEIRLRDTLARRDLSTLHRPFAEMQGQLDQGPHTVVALCRDLQPPTPLPNKDD